MKDIDEIAVNTIRFLAVDAVEKAKSGHPGLPMGAAAAAYTLWTRFLKHCPADPNWTDRDRFILSAGHGSMLVYALLHLFGYELSLEEIKNFRQWGSRTPGHPEFGYTPGVETTTGPLGQGFANAVGMAMAERRLAAEFNRPGYPLIDHHTYTLAGDGCMMEGISSEAASLAGHHRLGKLICLYDDNEITIDGSTELTFTEDVGKRFAAYGWQVLTVDDGNRIDQVEEAITEAKKDLARPSLIMVRTRIGCGAPAKEGTAGVHGAPLGSDEVAATKQNLDWPLDPAFHVPREVYDHFAAYRQSCEEKKQKWDVLFEKYRKEYPEEATKWERWFSGEVPPEIASDSRLRDFGEDPDATRASSGKVMQILTEYLPNLFGGSADLAASTKTTLKDKDEFQPASPGGSNIHFGVREHAMGAVLSGIMLHGGLRPFGSTFLVFFDYMKPAVRLAAMMGLPVIYIYTHDSIAVGEDGPTHQPVEQLAHLRSTPNMHVLRPADGKETAVAWRHALQRRCGPTALVCSRQKLPQLEGTGEKAFKGGYIISGEQPEEPDLILIASGSEVSLALQAREALEQKGFKVRVVSMVSRELFLAQDPAYREKVLPAAVKCRLVIEAAHPLGWESFAGPWGAVIGIDDFGASAPGPKVMEKYGFRVEAVVEKAEELLSSD